jgi:calcineurin-like phosphoesterase family protein
VSKIVFLGDAHLSDKQISTRVDDSAQTALQKLEWVVDYAIRNKAPIIHTGDLTSGQLLTNAYRVRVREILGRRGLDFWSIAGNHDEKENKYASVWEREYGLFHMDGYVRHLYDGDLGSVFNLGSTRIPGSTRILGYSA